MQPHAHGTSRGSRHAGRHSRGVPIAAGLVRQSHIADASAAEGRSLHTHSSLSPIPPPLLRVVSHNAVAQQWKCMQGGRPQVHSRKVQACKIVAVPSASDGSAVSPIS